MVSKLYLALILLENPKLAMDPVRELEGISRPGRPMLEGFKDHALKAGFDRRNRPGLVGRRALCSIDIGFTHTGALEHRNQYCTLSTLWSSFNEWIHARNIGLHTYNIRIFVLA